MNNFLNLFLSSENSDNSSSHDKDKKIKLKLKERIKIRKEMFGISDKEMKKFLKGKIRQTENQF